MKERCQTQQNEETHNERESENRKQNIFKISIMQNKVSIMHIFRVMSIHIISERKDFEGEINTSQIQTMNSEVKNSKLQAK